MHQRVEYEPTPSIVDLDGHVDRRGFRYLGPARRQPNGRYVVLAAVEGCLCWVEVTLTFLASEHRGS